MPDPIDQEQFEALRAMLARVTAERDQAVTERDQAVTERDRAVETKKRLERKLAWYEQKLDELLRKLECDCCGGRRTSIGSPEVTERLDYIPGSLIVKEIVRPRFRCPRCQDGTAIAPLPEPALDVTRGRAEPGLLANIVVSKYNDHLPLYRQSEILARQGIELSRSTLCDWVYGTAELLQPIASAVLADVLSRPVIGLDVALGSLNDLSALRCLLLICRLGPKHPPDPAFH